MIFISILLVFSTLHSFSGNIEKHELVDANVLTFNVEYVGCPDGSNTLKTNTLRITDNILSSQDSNYIHLRSELNMSLIESQDLRMLESPIDSLACEQINQFLNEYQVGFDDDNFTAIYYEAGGFYFASFGIQSGNMIGFVPIYTFNEDFELIYVWVE
ncbi:MAG: hypothetical protein LAT84_02050 [Balneolia bacterium]|nr:hypothetical protein [Balneolia bacterium]